VPVFQEGLDLCGSLYCVESLKFDTAETSWAIEYEVFGVSVGYANLLKIVTVTLLKIVTLKSLPFCILLKT